MISSLETNKLQKNKCQDSNDGCKNAGNLVNKTYANTLDMIKF